MIDINLSEKIESDKRYYNCIHEEKNNNTFRTYVLEGNDLIPHDIKGVTCRPCFSTKLYDQFSFEGLK